MRTMIILLSYYFPQKPSIVVGHPNLMAHYLITHTKEKKECSFTCTVLTLILMKLRLTEIWVKSCRKLADKVGAAGYLAVVPDLFYGDAYKPVGEDLRAGFTQWLPKHLPVIFCTTPFVTYLVFHYPSHTQHKIWTHHPITIS